MPVADTTKQRVLECLNMELEAATKELQELAEMRAKRVEDIMRNRLNSVSVSLWNVKIKDVLDLERNQRLDLETLLADMDKLKRDTVRSTSQDLHRFSRFRDTSSRGSRTGSTTNISKTSDH
ncbi:hypothetical protein DFJ63DRAFT_317375 [Scheffersomyces coipomensis]|uniref:uncharacterized protein n=1 Tax=Scheffersomyces coipomensis TaxID=1788519 RepID=UPI00315D5134